MDEIIKYAKSKDGLGLLAYSKECFYHIHSDELTKLEQWILARLCKEANHNGINEN